MGYNYYLPSDIEGVHRRKVEYGPGSFPSFIGGELAMWEVGDCIFRGYGCTYEVAVTLNYFDGETKIEIHVTIFDGETGRDIVVFSSNSGDWPFIWEFMPGELWPREMYAGAKRAGNDTEDEQLRAAIDEYTANYWSPEIEEAEETDWAGVDDISGLNAPDISHGVVSICSGMAEDPSGDQLKWVRVVYNLDESGEKTLDKVGMGPVDPKRPPYGLSWFYIDDTSCDFSPIESIKHND